MNSRHQFHPDDIINNEIVVSGGDNINEPIAQEEPSIPEIELLTRCRYNYVTRKSGKLLIYMDHEILNK